MKTNRHKIKEDKSWIWLCSIIGVLFVTFCVLSACASLKSNKPSTHFARNSAHFDEPELTPDKFYPPVLRSLIINPQSKTNYFDFVLDTGNNNFSHQDQLTPLTKELIHYFFLGLALPSEDFWVNLNPVQPDAIASPRLTATDIGKVLLEVDLKLKKDASRLTDPRTPTGQRYWSKLKQNLKENGIHSLQSLPLSRLWILPKDAILQERGPHKVNIVSAKLKVCLESEYLKEQNSSLVLTSSQDPQEKIIQDCAVSAMKETIVPVIEYAVNYSSRYAPIRQVYYSLILAEYYKQKYWGKKSVYDYYINQGRLSGLHSATPWSKGDFFNSYVESYQNGEYSFYQQEYDPYQSAMMKKHYFSGGSLFAPLTPGFNKGREPVDAVASPISNGQLYLAKAFTAATEPFSLKGIQLAYLSQEETEGAFSSPINSPADFLISKMHPIKTTCLGKDTVRLDVELSGGAKGHFVVPAGTSTGEDEAKTVGVEKAIENLTKIHAKVTEKNLKAHQLTEIAQVMLEMDKDNLGAEATLSYQMALAWAVARQKGLEPYELIRELAPDVASRGVPETKIQFNITNGGEHAENNLDMQEFMIVPKGKTIAEANRMCDEIDRALGLIYQSLGLKANPDDRGVGDMRGKEGGYKIEDLTLEKLEDIYKNAESYKIKNLDLVELREKNIGIHEFILNCLIAAIKNAGYEPSKSGEIGTVSLALDPATTAMLVEGYINRYHYEGRQIVSRELADIFDNWIKNYPIDSIEDGMAENDWDGWMLLIEMVGDKVRLIGDDSFVTQAGRLMKFINMLKEKGFVDKETGKVTKKLGILIKLNQNGFLTTGINDLEEGYLGTLEVIQLARKYGFEIIVSHRSREAEPEENEVSIAELAAGVDAYALKSGDHVQAIRAVKEDRLAEIYNREKKTKNSSPISLEAKQVLTSIVKKRPDGSILAKIEVKEDMEEFASGFAQTWADSGVSDLDSFNNGGNLHCLRYRSSNPDAPGNIIKIFIDGETTDEELLSYALKLDIWGIFGSEERAKLIALYDKAKTSSPISLEQAEQPKVGGIDLRNITFKVVF